MGSSRPPKPQGPQHEALISGCCAAVVTIVGQPQSPACRQEPRPGPTTRVRSCYITCSTFFAILVIHKALQRVQQQQMLLLLPFSAHTVEPATSPIPSRHIAPASKY